MLISNEFKGYVMARMDNIHRAAMAKLFKEYEAQADRISDLETKLVISELPRKRQKPKEPEE